MLQRSLDTIKQILSRRSYQKIQPVVVTTCLRYQVYEIHAVTSDLRGGRPVIVLWVVQNGMPVIIYKSILTLLLQKKLLVYTPHIICITSSMSHSALALLQEYCDYFETIRFEETLYMILSHIYVPEYRLLLPEEVKTVESKYGDRRRFPKMLYQMDAVARIMDFRPGDIIQVFNKSPTNGTSTFYRQVTRS